MVAGGAGESIRAAALTLFHQVGYHGTTVRDIAREAGLTVASMYHHFASKQDLLVHIMRTAMEENLAAVEHAAASADEPVAQLRQIVSAIIDYHTTHPAEAFVGNSELRSLEPAGRTIIVGLRDREEALLVAVVQRGIDGGVFEVTDPKVATRAIVAMCSAVATWYRPRGRLGRAEVRRQYVELGLNLVGHRST